MPAIWARERPAVHVVATSLACKSCEGVDRVVHAARRSVPARWGSAYISFPRFKSPPQQHMGALNGLNEIGTEVRRISQLYGIFPLTSSCLFSYSRNEVPTGFLGKQVSSICGKKMRQYPVYISKRVGRVLPDDSYTARIVPHASHHICNG